jgi:hypothetical protein
MCETIQPGDKDQTPTKASTAYEGSCMRNDHILYTEETDQPSHLYLLESLQTLQSFRMQLLLIEDPHKRLEILRNVIDWLKRFVEGKKGFKPNDSSEFRGVLELLVEEEVRDQDSTKVRGFMLEVDLLQKSCEGRLQEEIQSVKKEEEEEEMDAGRLFGIASGWSSPFGPATDAE